jgi:hypothetical protein
MTNPADLDRPPGGRPGWADLLDTLAAAGAQAGRTAADWWVQDTVGGRATGDTAAVARRVLAGLDDGDPAVLDSLPTPVPDDGQWYDEAAPAGAPELADFTAAEREAAVDAYRDGFDTAVTDTVGAHCRAAASPTDDGRDLSPPAPRPGPDRRRSWPTPLDCTPPPRSSGAR